VAAESCSESIREIIINRATQLADDGLSAVIAYCRSGNQPNKDEVRTLPEEARELLLQWESLTVRDEILYRRYQHLDGATKCLQLVLPGKLRRMLNDFMPTWAILDRPRPLKQSADEFIFRATTLTSLSRPARFATSHRGADRPQNRRLCVP